MGTGLAGLTRISAPYVRSVPAFGPWDDRTATPRSLDVLELQIPAARGKRPYVPTQSEG